MAREGAVGFEAAGPRVVGGGRLRIAMAEAGACFLHVGAEVDRKCRRRDPPEPLGIDRQAEEAPRCRALPTRDRTEIADHAL